MKNGKNCELKIANDQTVTEIAEVKIAKPVMALNRCGIYVYEFRQIRKH